ncbi:hypothetical protein B0H12DRAFT_1028599 [Mycena haematopus]|nr:hypothetical protein B0H12DRAFT_1028599 [Mycena haematopus]
MDLLGLGLRLVVWDGKCALVFPPLNGTLPFPRTSRPLVDAQGRILAVLVGQPDDDGYRTAVRRAFDFISSEGCGARFPASMRHHRRGLFAAINIGLTHGKGQLAPTWMDNGVYTPLVARLLANQDIIRMANFASAAFALWAPRLHAYYVDYNKRLCAQLPHLRRPFPNSVFSSVAFNFGPRVRTFKHRDVCNLPFGWCAVQALGNFDATKGGHLVLWDLDLVVEFPSGALILLPSATVAHSNTAVQATEERISFTQFTAGGLFRYVDNGFRTQDQLAAEDPAEYERMMAKKEVRWEEGLALFSKVDELLDL